MKHHVKQSFKLCDPCFEPESFKLHAIIWIYYFWCIIISQHRGDRIRLTRVFNLARMGIKLKVKSLSYSRTLAILAHVLNEDQVGLCAVGHSAGQPKEHVAAKRTHTLAHSTLLARHKKSNSSSAGLFHICIAFS
jgi:hypothetical protein